MLHPTYTEGCQIAKRVIRIIPKTTNTYAYFLQNSQKCYIEAAVEISWQYYIYVYVYIYISYPILAPDIFSPKDTVLDTKVIYLWKGWILHFCDSCHNALHVSFWPI